MTKVNDQYFTGTTVRKKGQLKHIWNQLSFLFLLAAVECGAFQWWQEHNEGEILGRLWANRPPTPPQLHPNADIRINNHPVQGRNILFTATFPSLLPVEFTPMDIFRDDNDDDTSFKVPNNQDTQKDTVTHQDPQSRRKELVLKAFGSLSLRAAVELPLHSTWKTRKDYHFKKTRDTDLMVRRRGKPRSTMTVFVQFEANVQLKTSSNTISNFDDPLDEVQSNGESGTTEKDNTESANDILRTPQLLKQSSGERSRKLKRAGWDGEYAKARRLRSLSPRSSRKAQIKSKLCCTILNFLQTLMIRRCSFEVGSKFLE
ncbi:unnamed protein product [Orchesella dallaii]|uniref:Uncharacterized protein n=1 Tax=Orchesella dallaii TaxID=48710 RepID=A0ABP1RRN8_9HEXA